MRAQDWYDNAWPLRRAVTVDNSLRTGDLTDYTVKVSLSSSNFNFTQAQSTGADLRFTDADGTTPLAFWIETYDAAASAAILWVKVPFIPASSQHTVYLYYGNTSALRADSGPNTFLLFSGFDSTFTVINPAMPDNFSRKIGDPKVSTVLIPHGPVGAYDHWGMSEEADILIEPDDPDTTHLYKFFTAVLHDSLLRRNDTTMFPVVYTSPDGIHWTGHGPVMDEATGDTIFGDRPWTVKLHGTYYMYMEGKSLRYDTNPRDCLEAATSTDAMHWTWRGIVLDTTLSRSWMSSYVSHPSAVVRNDSIFLFFEAAGPMSYTVQGRTHWDGGKNIGMAISTDGLHFSVYGNQPMLAMGDSGSWYGPPGHAMVCTSEIKVGDTYWMIFNGYGNNNTRWKTGFAYSTDLFHWTYYAPSSNRPDAFYTSGPYFYWERDGSLCSYYNYQTLPADPLSNEIRARLVLRDSSRWAYGSQWTLTNMGSNYGEANSDNGSLLLSGESFIRSSNSILSSATFTNNFEIRVRSKTVNFATNPRNMISIGSGNVISAMGYDLENPVLAGGYAWGSGSTGVVLRMETNNFRTVKTSGIPLRLDYNQYHDQTIRFFDDSLKWYEADTLRSAMRDTAYHSSAKRMMVSEGEYADGSGGERYIDWVMVRKYVSREPLTQIGTAQTHAFVQVLSPNGGEEWKVGVPGDVRWNSIAVSPWVRIELNRNYPSGGWEVLADSIQNNGQFAAEVTDPLSDHCRIRVVPIGDAIQDESDQDFRIIPDMHLLAPHGGEHWLLHETHIVQWFAVGWPGLIRVELNRNYPTDSWSIAADSLPNNGIAYIDAGDSVAEACRIRVSTIGAAFSVMSDSNFFITNSQGYLVMVRPRQPTIPVNFWNIGTVECPRVPTDTFLLRNLGEQDVTIYSAPEPAGGMFEQRSSCGEMTTVPPGQLSACELVLSFGLPDHEGIYMDTLLIPTDASNQQGGYVRIPLVGHRVSTPAAPVITVNAEGNDIRLLWYPSAQSINGCALSNVQYRVYSAPAYEGPFTLLATTGDTTYVHTNALSDRTAYYKVTTWTDATVFLSNEADHPLEVSGAAHPSAQ